MDKRWFGTALGQRFWDIRPRWHALSPFSSARTCAWLRTISPPDCCAAWCQVCYWRTTVSGRERSREPGAVYGRWLGNPANHGTSAEFRDTIFLDKAQNQQCCGLEYVEMIPHFLDCLNGDAATILFVSVFCFDFCLRRSALNVAGWTVPVRIDWFSYLICYKHIAIS